MKTGPEFTRSRTAHHFDELFRQPARASRLMVEFALPRLVGIAPDEIVIEEPRVSVDGTLTTIRRFRTRDAKGDYLSSLARLLEKTTLDHLPQADDKSRAVFGYRQVNLQDHERIYGSATIIPGGPELLMRHTTVVGPTDAGQYSTFAFGFHAEQDSDVMTRMRCNITDVEHDSIPYRISMLSTGVLNILRHEFGN